MIWLLPLALGAGVLWAVNRAGRAAPPIMMTPAQTSAMFAPPPYAGEGLPGMSGGGMPGMMSGGGGASLAPMLGAYVAPALQAQPYDPASDPALYGAQPLMGVYGAPPQSQMNATPQQPIATLRCAAERCWVRPEPRQWDDATMGRFGFTAPRGFPIHVLSFGPTGWANVVVEHPDDGMVEGWVETQYLESAPSGMASSSAARPSGGGSAQGIAAPGKDGAKVSTAATTAAYQRMSEYLGRRGQRMASPTAIQASTGGMSGGGASRGGGMPASSVQGRSSPRMRRQQQRSAKKRG